MTVLDEIIDASSDPNVGTADLLRKVQVVAHRVQASEVLAWVKNELGGYSQDADLPDYRVQGTSVMGRFSGPMRSFQDYPLTIQPAGMEHLWTARFTQPLSELQALAEMDKDPGLYWSPFDLQRYEKSGVFRMELFVLYSAHQVITRQSLRGLLDVIRTHALELALELQSADPAAGAVGGPTVSTAPQVSNVVNNITQNIYGHGNNVAAGQDISQKSKVTVGDVEGLRREVMALGLRDEDAQTFLEAIADERALDAPRVAGFLERVRSGAIAVAGSVSSSVAAGLLTELASGFLGL